MKRVIITSLMLAFATVIHARPFENVDCEEFASRIGKKQVQILDVRTEEEFREGHIEGALQISVSDPEFESKAKAMLDKEREVAVYCRSGRRSSAAARKLETMGYDVFNLESGILAWTAEKRKTVR